MHIKIVCSCGIDLLAQGWIGLIRRAELDGVCTRQGSITTISHRGASFHSYTERDTTRMQALRALGKRKRNCLGHTGGRDAG